MFGQMRGVQEKPLTAFAVFQGPRAQYNQYTKVAQLGWHVPSSCSHISKWHILLPFHPQWRPFHTVKLYANLHLVGNRKH